MIGCTRCRAFGHSRFARAIPLLQHGTHSEVHELSGSKKQDTQKSGTTGRNTPEGDPQPPPPPPTQRMSGRLNTRERSCQAPEA